jgi:hypothetical protein
VIENNAEVVVPLLLNTIPSGFCARILPKTCCAKCVRMYGAAKLFREAISSLSAAQQRFASQFRAMQLEASMFAVTKSGFAPSFVPRTRFLCAL